MSVRIVGAGFSGLTLAYHLTQRGVPVVVYEKRSEVGGLIGSTQHEWGLVEHAANAFLADADMEQMVSDLKVPLATRFASARRRYIYWKTPTRWPLNWASTLRLIWFALRSRMGLASVEPKHGESVMAWGERVVDRAFTERLLTPALQGVYAGDAGQMSARLTVGKMLFGQTHHGRLRGSQAPVAGMGQLMQALKERLIEKGVLFRMGVEFQPESVLTEPLVLCTNPWDAAKILRPTNPQLAEQLQSADLLPLVSVTLTFPKRSTDLKGFGCLFAQGQGFQALGVVFNDCLFTGRARGVRSETWILGGANLRAVAQLSESQVVECILADRARLIERPSDKPLNVQIQNWPKAIPHYTLQWESTLNQLQVSPPLYLHGNYLGDLGLSRIHRRSLQLAQEIQENLRGK